MTDLQDDSPQQAESQQIGLLQEVIYWLHLPEVQEDPVALDLASWSRTLLSEMSPTGDMHCIFEVHKNNLRQLVTRVTEGWLQVLAPSEVTLPPTTCHSRRKKKKVETGGGTGHLLKGLLSFPCFTSCW